MVRAEVPQCEHFNPVGSKKFKLDGVICSGRKYHQCSEKATVAVLDEFDLRSGEFCSVHAEQVHAELACFDGPDKWRMVPVVRGNPLTGEHEEPS